MNLYLCMPEAVCFANDNDALIPQVWAMEGLMQLEEHMVAANLVHRDYEPAVAKFGQTVNCHRPANFKIRRKTDSTTSLDKQDASVDSVAVKLNQWGYNSFVIKDGEESYSMKELIPMYLVPSMRVIARTIDRAILGHFHKFLSTPAYRAGRLGNLASSTSHEVVLDARETLNRRHAPTDANRHLVLNSMSETALLKNDMFLKANERGDGGEALENARLGRILGFNTWLAQNVPYCDLLSTDAVTGTLTTGVAAGTTLAKGTTGVVDGFGAAATKGCFFTIAGNDQPQWMTDLTTTADPDTHGITANEATKYATADGAVVTYYPAWTMKAEVKAAGSVDELNVASGYTNPPQVGQLVAFGDTTSTRKTYTIIEVEEDDSSGYNIWLDRPLDAEVGSGASAFPGPAGAYNLAFHRESLALVTRPVAIPPSSRGVQAGIAVYNNIPMRVLMQYDVDSGGTQVVLDVLFGVKELDADLAVVMLG